MLNVAHIKMTLNDVRSIFVDDFMRNSNFGIGVLHVKRQILAYYL